MNLLIYITYFCSLILETQTDHVISSCKALMRKKSIEVFVVLFVHSNITIIDDITWKIALLKKIKNKKAPSKEKKEITRLFALRF